MRILIIRTSALGDIVHCLPVLTALGRQHPGARIGWVVEASIAPLLENHPDIDHLIVVATRRWRKEPFARRTRREVRQLRRELADFAADVALDLMGNHKAAILARLSGARRRIGLRREERREPSSAFWINEEAECEAPHAVDKALAIASRLGLDTAAPSFGGERLGEAVPAEIPAEPYVIVFPATGWANKNYPPDAFGEAVHGIGRASSTPVYVSPGPGEEAVAAEVAEASGGVARVLPVLPIPALVALARRARLAIGGDTGPIHLAHALGTPVLCIMGPTDPERNGPYRAPGNTLFERLPCSFCYKRYSSVKPCLLSIPPARLEERAIALLHVG